VFLDDQDDVWLDENGRIAGRQFIALTLDDELSARMSETDLLIFR
jgi:hypothetical protein